MVSALNQLSLLSDSGPDNGRNPWVVRESARARRLAVRVHRTGQVEVVVPPRTAPGTVQRFIESHRGWIEERRAAALRSRPPEQPFPPDRIEFGVNGENWRLHLTGGAGRLRLATYDHLLIVTGDATAPGALRRKLTDWLMDRAQAVLEPLLAQVAVGHGFRHSKVVIRRQRTRWGSCSSRGVISLNVSLMFQPSAVVRYLLTHELSHTRHMDHSPRFWACVEACCPDWRERDRQLLQGWRRVPSWLFDPAEES